jgi:hypothetical protein
MVRKSTLVLMIVIFGLMFYTGCGEDDGGGNADLRFGPPIIPEGGIQPPGAGEGPPLSAACQKCICPFFSVPMTEECWASSPAPLDLDTRPQAERDYFCRLTEQLGIVDESKPLMEMGVQISREAGSNPFGPACYIVHNKTDCIIPGLVPPGRFGNLGGLFPMTGDLKTEDLEACVGCLEQYDFELRASRTPPDRGVRLRMCAQLP